MKDRITRLIKAILFILVLGICVLLVTMVVRRKDSSEKYADFFDQAKKGNIDVLFMGSSHVINGINPVNLYESYGYTSYNMGGHGSVMQATYWELIEALNYCQPKWVVVDAYMLEKDYQYLDVMYDNTSESERSSSIEQLHLNMDAWPLDKLKIAAISDLISDKDIRKEFLFDFIVYHSRWNELGKRDFAVLSGDDNSSKMFGAQMRYEVDKSATVYADPEPEQGLSTHTVGQEYLMKIIDECQRRGIGILVTYLPFCATTEDKMAAKSAGDIAGMYEAPYINMLNADIIDIYTDLNDPGHLNALGAKKVTEYLGEWLYENGGMTDHRGDAAYSYYDDCALRFNDEIVFLSSDGYNLYQQLEMLAMDNVSSIVYINQGSGALEDGNTKRLIKRISGTDKIEATGGPYILINDLESGKKYEAADGEMIDGASTTIGTMVYQPVEQLFRFLYAKENEEINYLYDDQHVWHDIQIITYDKFSGEILSHVYYKTYGHEYIVD